MKDRADKILVKLGHYPSRASAQAAIAEGKVKVDGSRLSKSSQLLSDDASIQAEQLHPYVSRGGVKLLYGLETFHVLAEGKVCLDIGASTGGFVDVLLQAGALKVFAVDVGRDQLHDLLRQNPNVIVLESTDARALTVQHIPSPPDIIVSDVSFAGLEKVMATPLSLATASADYVGLFKPQFQVGKGFVGKGGIVSDEVAVERARLEFSEWLKKEGWRILSWTASPIKGGDGNAEYLFHAKRTNLA